MFGYIASYMGKLTQETQTCARVCEGDSYPALKGSWQASYISTSSSIVRANTGLVKTSYHQKSNTAHPYTYHLNWMTFARQLQWNITFKRLSALERFTRNLQKYCCCQYTTVTVSTLPCPVQCFQQGHRAGEHVYELDIVLNFNLQWYISTCSFLSHLSSLPGRAFLKSLSMLSLASNRGRHWSVCCL